MASVAALRAYVSAGESHDDFLAECLDEATSMVDVFVGEAEVPAVIADRAYLEAAAELYHRRQAPHGQLQFATPDSQPVRIPRDPLTSVYPLLRRWVGAGLS